MAIPQQCLHGKPTMEIINISYLIYLISVVSCFSDSESAESNRIEVTPLYDTIIYSDIAEILNEFENNNITPYDITANSESQSDEKLENLLTEYQHYLEKAHKQRKSYIEKSKTKNKVPAFRHDQYSKIKPGMDWKPNDFYFANSIYTPDPVQMTQTLFKNPLDILIPINPKGKFRSKQEITPTLPKGGRGDIFEKIIYDHKKMLDLPSVLRKSTFESVQSPCYCKNGRIPCECDCKQCLIHVQPFSREQMKIRSQTEQKKNSLSYPPAYEKSVKKSDHLINDLRDITENMLRVNIKIDMELPKIQEIMGKLYQSQNRDRTVEHEDAVSKELTSIKLPFPLNMPMPMDILGYKKSSKYKEDYTPIHNISMHKKKRPRANNSNKKHRKKIITFHNINLEAQPLYPIIPFESNASDAYRKINSNSFNSTINNMTNISTEQPNNVLQLDLMTSHINKTYDILNDTHIEKNINFTVNMSKTITTNEIENSLKLENSIESDFTNMSANMTTVVPLIRKKREISVGNILVITSNLTDPITRTENFKKSDKNLLSDAELLYWPSTKINDTKNDLKNITTIILEKEHKKAKLNISKETIRLNHTKALEQAIFGDVNWDDIDTVVPAFLSFVGKYVQGILTFCSEEICHSMKCANKTCLHRICVPAHRLNNKGHCTGSNSTDSVASMESIMDLPSNVAFEVVDILQNKMLGKIFGKATFCINSKCIILIACKKIFVKYRCTMKELDTTGHCSNVKTTKNV